MEIGGEFRVTNQEYETAYANSESPEFKAKALEMEGIVSAGTSLKIFCRDPIPHFFFTSCS